MNRLNPIIKLVAAAAAIAAAGSAFSASLTVYPVVIDTAAPRAQINIVNKGDKPIVLEAQGERVAARAEAGVFPPVATLQPGARQIFRVILPPAGDTTQHWRVRVTEVTARKVGGEAAGGSQVASELSFAVPVFQVKADAVARLVRDGEKVVNAGNRQVLISQVGDKKTHVWLLPGQSVDAPEGVDLYSLESKLDVETGGPGVTVTLRGQRSE